MAPPTPKHRRHLQRNNVSCGSNKNPSSTAPSNVPSASATLKYRWQQHLRISTDHGVYGKYRWRWHLQISIDNGAFSIMLLAPAKTAGHGPNAKNQLQLQLKSTIGSIKCAICRSRRRTKAGEQGVRAGGNRICPSVKNGCVQERRRMRRGLFTDGRGDAEGRVDSYGG